MRIHRIPFAFAVLLALAASAAAQSISTYRVTQSVGSLSLGQPGIADPYLFLDFQLTDGAGTGNGNSAVTISNLALTGGTIDYDDRRLPDLGNVIGSGDAFTLFGDSGLADRAVLFRVNAANAVLTYDLTLFSMGVDAPTPDGFNVALLYRTGADVFDFNIVQTLGPTGNEMVAYTFDGQTSTRPLGFGVNPTFTTARALEGDNRFAALGVPMITPLVVPEPTALLSLTLGVLAVRRRRA